MARIDRDAALALIAEQDINQILEEAPQASASLSTFRTIRMGTAVARMPVIDALPVAGWVTETDDETGVKPTSVQSWARRELIAEELAVIVPIPENVFDDTSFNVWDEVRPRIVEAFGQALDLATLFGVDKPSTWDADALVPGAVAAGNVHTEGGGVDLADDINETWALVEADGYDVNVQYASRRLRASLRGLRDNANHPIYLPGLRSDGRADELMGEPLHFVTNGSWDPEAATLIAGDRTKAVLGIRQDVTYKLLEEATLTGFGNLAERDHIALRAKFRVAFATAEHPTRDGGSDAYPFAVLQPASG